MIKYYAVYFFTKLLTVFLVHFLNFPNVHPITKDVLLRNAWKLFVINRVPKLLMLRGKCCGKSVFAYSLA